MTVPEVRALLQHLNGDSLGHQPALRDIGIHHIKEPRRRHFMNLGHVILARSHDENINMAELLNCLRHDAVAIFLCGWANVDG